MKITKSLIFKLLSLLSLVTAIVLEALPNGAALRFAPGPDEILMRYYSYFDFTPFGYANFAPLITAVLTILLTVFSVVLLCLKCHNPKLDSAMLAVTISTIIISVCPIFLGLDCYTVLGIVITLMLTASAIFYVFSLVTAEEDDGKKSGEEQAVDKETNAVEEESANDTPPAQDDEIK